MPSSHPEHLLSVEEAHQILTPHLGGISECIQKGCDAWKRFGQTNPDLLVDSSLRSKACLVFDAIRGAAKRHFRDDPRVLIVDKRGSFWMVFEGKVTLRFKKLNKNGRTSNISTNQQTLFSMQCQLELPGMPDQPTNLTAGYQFDPFGMNLQKQVIRCAFGRDTMWEFALPTVGNEVKADIQLTTEPEQAASKTKTKVTLKPHLQTKKNEPEVNS